MVTMGIRGGLLNRRFDPTKFQSGDQWDAVTGYNPAILSPDVLSKSGATVLDIGAGWSYFDANGNKTINLFGVAAAFHLTRPEDPFINNSVTLHGGARINLSAGPALLPTLSS